MSRSLVVMRYGFYANSFWVDSHLADFHFFLYFFQAYMLPSGVSVKLGLGLGLRLGVGFIFYI